MCSAGILTIQNVGELCAQRLQRLCIDKKETGSKAVSVRKNSTPYTKKERIVHPHLSRVMCYSYCSCIAAREFRSEWKPSSPNMAAASNGILSDAVTGGRSPGVFPSVEGICRIKLRSADYNHVNVRSNVCLLSGVRAEQDRFFSLVLLQQRQYSGDDLVQRIDMLRHSFHLRLLSYVILYFLSYPNQVGLSTDVRIYRCLRSLLTDRKDRRG